MNAKRKDDRSQTEAPQTAVADLMRASVDAMEAFMKTDWSKDAEKAGVTVNPLMANPAAMMAAATAMSIKMTGQWASAFLSVMEQAAPAEAAEAAEVQDAPESRPEPAQSRRAGTVKADIQTEPAENDDLKRISGIGPKLAKLLADRGIASFEALASLDEAGVKALDADLGLDGRIARDDWVGQAAAFLKGAG